MNKSPKKTAKLSVIILNYNSGNYLAECLQSLSKSDTHNFSLETIVVDNASTDDSVLKIKKFIKPFSLRVSPLHEGEIKRGFDFKLKINKSNVGFSAGNNIGINLISPQTKYVLFLNPDTKVEKDTLSKLINFFEKNPRVSAATCKIILATTGKIQHECHRGFPTPWNAFSHFTGLGKLFPRSKFFNSYFQGHLDLDTIHPIEACSGAFLMIRRKVGELINWWNEKYFMYGEDLDLCYKLRQQNYQLYYYPHCQITHYQGISSGLGHQNRQLSPASRQTKVRSALATTNAMRIFYQENLFQKYPPVLRSLVLFGIKLLELFRVFKAKYL